MSILDRIFGEEQELHDIDELDFDHLMKDIVRQNKELKYKRSCNAKPLHQVMREARHKQH